MFNFKFNIKNKILCLLENEKLIEKRFLMFNTWLLERFLGRSNQYLFKYNRLLAFKI